MKASLMVMPYVREKYLSLKQILNQSCFLTNIFEVPDAFNFSAILTSSGLIYLFCVTIPLANTYVNFLISDESIPIFKKKYIDTSSLL